MSAQEFVTIRETIKIADLDVVAVTNTKDNSLVCYEYKGYDIYHEKHEIDGEIYYFYIYNNLTQDETHGFQNLEDSISYIEDEERIAKNK